MKQSTKRFVSVLASMGFLIVAFVIFIALTRPQYEEAKEIRSEEASRRNFIETQKGAIEKVTNLIAMYQGETELRGVVQMVLPIAPEVASGLAQLNGLAAMHTLGPQSFSITSVVAPTLRSAPQAKEGPQSLLARPVATILIRVKLLGEYENFKRFLADLETNIRLFDVQDIQVEHASGLAENFFSYDVQVAAYYQST